MHLYILRRYPPHDARAGPAHIRNQFQTIQLSQVKFLTTLEKQKEVEEVQQELLANSKGQFGFGS
jgi:hypothetical protein